MESTEQLGSGTSFKQHYSRGTETSKPFGQSTWHCYVHVNMFAHAGRLSPQHHCCITKLFMVDLGKNYPFPELKLQESIRGAD